MQLLDNCVYLAKQCNRRFMHYFKLLTNKCKTLHLVAMYLFSFSCVQFTLYYCVFSLGVENALMTGDQELSVSM